MSLIKIRDIEMKMKIWKNTLNVYVHVYTENDIIKIQSSVEYAAKCNKVKYLYLVEIIATLRVIQ